MNATQSTLARGTCSPSPNVKTTVRPMCADYSRLPARPERSRQHLHVVVESPRGSRLKIKYEPKLGVFELGRALPEGLSYPHDWGFVPGTRAPDGDPLDALVFWDTSSVTGLLIECRPLGVIKLEQQNKAGRRLYND